MTKRDVLKEEDQGRIIASTRFTLPVIMNPLSMGVSVEPDRPRLQVGFSCNLWTFSFSKVLHFQKPLTYDCKNGANKGGNHHE